MTSSKTRAAIASAARTVVKTVATALKVVLPKSAPPTLYRLGDKTGRLYVIAEHIMDGMVTDGNAIFHWAYTPMGVRQSELVASTILEGDSMFEFQEGLWVKHELKNPPPIDAVAAKDYSCPVVSVVEGDSPSPAIKEALHVTLADGRVVAADADYLAPLVKDTKDLTIEATQDGRVIRVTRNRTAIAYIGSVPVPTRGE